MFYLQASFVAIWILTIFWAITLLVRMFSSTYKESDNESGKMKDTRPTKANAAARDGLLLLVASVFTAYAARASVGAINALSWIFFGFWTVVICLCYLISEKKVLLPVQFIGYLLIFTSFIVSWATQQDTL